MGLRGPVKKPADEQLRKGNPGRRPISIVPESASVDVNWAMPEQPSWLSKNGKAQWQRLAPKLVEHELLGPVDGDLFGQLCNWLAVAIDCEKTMAKGLYKKNSNNTKTLIPEVKLAQTAWKEVNKLAPLFGLSPKARQSLGKQLKAPVRQDDREKTKNSILGIR